MGDLLVGELVSWLQWLLNPLKYTICWMALLFTENVRTNIKFKSFLLKENEIKLRERFHVII